MGGPITYYLSKLKDVAIVDPLTGEVLVYNSVTEKWENKAPPAAAAHQALTAKGTTDVTYWGSAWQDMPQMSITLTTGNNPVLILFTASCTTNGYSGYFRLLVDGVVEAGVTIPYNYVNPMRPCPSISVLKTLSAGEHTIKVQWHSYSVGFIIGCAPASDPDEEHRQLTVIELKC